MAKFYDRITEAMREFIAQQHIYFVATAPLSAEGHVNMSPKGHESFRVVSKVVYLDLTGSGSETSAHVHENGRITLMWCAFDGPPNIVRLFGQGRTALPGDTDWDDLCALFPTYLSTRQMIVVDVTKTMTSCGYAVPYFDYAGERDVDIRWAEAKGPDGLETYRRNENAQSIDGLTTTLGLRLAQANSSETPP